MKSKPITHNDIPWNCQEFTEAVDNLLKAYWNNTPYDPKTWRPGIITHVSLKMRKDGKAEADICLKFVGE